MRAEVFYDFNHRIWTLQFFDDNGNLMNHVEHFGDKRGITIGILSLSEKIKVIIESVTLKRFIKKFRSA